jgi:ABC-2 type transport system permease protein
VTARGTILKLEAAQLLRNAAVVIGIVALLLTGVAAIQHGANVIERQRVALAQAPSLQQEQHRAILGVLPPTAVAGDQAYYLQFFTGHEPSPWAPVSIGQRDVHAFNLKVRMLSIHGQLYDADLANPLLTAFGNFDLAFVLVFLVPLLAIAVTFDLWSGERELGTWDLVRSQPSSAMRVLAVKVIVRGTLVLVPAVVLVVLAALWLRLPLDGHFAGVLGATVVYVVAWLGAALVIVAMRRSSDFNLIALLALWVVWAVLGPALVTMTAAARYPVGESLEIAVRQRQGYHGSWDRPVAETMALFYARYPQWRGSVVPEDRYSNAWYYGMQHRGDLEAEPAAAEWRATLSRRETWTSRLLVLFPPALFQRALNAMAGTDLESHLAYLDSVRAYHESLKRWYFPAIFDDRPISQMDWGSAPVHRHQATPRASTFTGAAWRLVLVTLVVLIGGLVLLARASASPSFKPSRAARRSPAIAGPQGGERAASTRGAGQ